MHICFVCREYLPSLRGGGIASYIYNMTTLLSEKGHKITIIAASDNTKEESDQIINNIRVIRLKGGDFVIKSIEKDSLINKLRIFYRFWSYRRRIIKKISEIKDIDIIEVPDYGAESLYFNKLQIPYVIRLHNPSLFNSSTLGITHLTIKNFPIYYQAWVELKLIQKSPYISSCSNSMKSWVEKNIPNLKAQIQTIYNPIKLSPVPPKQSINNEPFIFYAGTISEWKGCNDLISACIMLQEQGYKFNLYMAGKMGHYAEELKSKYKNYKWIKFIGKLDHKVLFQYYTNAEVVCFPSWWDNMPMVCIEAMMCGAIVIGSTSGGMKEIITDQVDGFHVPRKSINQLKDKIEYCLNLTPEKRKTISKNAHNKILKNFSDKIITQQMIEYYQNVINDFKQHRHESSIR